MHICASCCFFNTSGCVFCVILCFVSTFRGKKFVNRSSSHKMSNNQASIKKREKSPHHLQLIIEMCLFFNFESIEWMQWPKLHGQCIKQVEKKIIGKQKYLPIKTFGVSKYTKNKHCTHTVIKTYFRSYFRSAGKVRSTGRISIQSISSRLGANIPIFCHHKSRRPTNGSLIAQAHRQNILL